MSSPTADSLIMATIATKVDCEHEHMFVVPAYGDSPWLPRCLESLTRQTHRSTVIITTSTPTPRLSAVADQFGVRVFAASGELGIAADWNFALSHSNATWTTLAHQDDWYEPTYAESCLNAVRGVRDIQIVFTASNERDTATGSPGNTWFKRGVCRLAFATSDRIRSRARKRLLLSFGNPISCPSVMFHRSVLRDFQFEEGWRKINVQRDGVARCSL